MRILVAEDDQVIAEFVSQGLREAGHAVDVASTGTEALKKAQPGTPAFRAALRDALENVKNLAGAHGGSGFTPAAIMRSFHSAKVSSGLASAR